MGRKTGILTGWVATEADTQDHDQDDLDLEAGVNPDEDPTDLED